MKKRDSHYVTGVYRIRGNENCFVVQQLHIIITVRAGLFSGIDTDISEKWIAVDDLGFHECHTPYTTRNKAIYKTYSEAKAKMDFFELT